uniref:Uncharacterized protein n=1 Tax=Strongyloides papillosus TaxID=174720 RepID=A0A0N5B7H6_STREA
MDNIIASDEVNINNPPKDAFNIIPARSTGIWSFLVQLLTITVSISVILFFYVFINGQTTEDNVSRISNGKSWNFNVLDEVEQIFDTTNSSEKNSTSTHLFQHHMLNNETSQVLNELSNATINIGNSYRIEILRLIIISTFINIGIAILWLLSIFLLLLSVKFEIRDFIIVNGEFLLFSSLGNLCHSVLVGCLLFYMKTHHWLMIIIISSTSALLILTIFINIISCYFNWIWSRYVSYMNGDDSCLCFAKIAHLCGHRRRGSANVTTGEYVIPVATAHSNLPYIDEQPIRNFSNF